jgi:hypothetical protein
MDPMIPAPLQDFPVHVPKRVGGYWALDEGVMVGNPHVHLLTLAEFEALPKGIPLHGIDRSVVIVGVDEIDTDTRMGFIAFGEICPETDCGLVKF